MVADPAAGRGAARVPDRCVTDRRSAGAEPAGATRGLTTRPRWACRWQPGSKWALSNVAWRVVRLAVLGRSGLYTCEDLHVPVDVRKLSTGELTRIVLGAEMDTREAWDTLLADGIETTLHTESSTANADAPGTGEVWVGSVGYERFRLNTELAERLRETGVERVIDVRQLPISRRPGFAKSALGNALAEAGIEYRHVRALGNPKPTRDLYKSGRVEEGRAGYSEYLLSEQRDALVALVGLIREKRTALMCVEHDPATCHRSVILQALRRELGVEIEIAPIG